jgi:hypothetical protein
LLKIDMEKGVPRTPVGLPSSSGRAARPGPEEAGEKGEMQGEKPEKHPSGAKARVDFAGFMYGLKPVPFTEMSFSAACEVPGSLRNLRFTPVAKSVAARKCSWL